MSYISVTYHCRICDNAWGELVSRSERGPDLLLLCPDCGDCDTHEIPSAPTVLRASHPDGNNRFSALKEDAKLKVLEAQARPKDRTAIQAERKKLSTKAS